MEFVADTNNADAATVQNASVLIVKYRNKDLGSPRRSSLLAANRCSKNEAYRLDGAILQHVPPVAVLLAERHVVRHDVEDLSHSKFGKPR